jgi:hypothetical protein
VQLADSLPAQALQEAYTSLPFPAASALRQVHQAQNAKERYEAVIESAEILAITTTVTVAALLRARCSGGALPLREPHATDQDLVQLRSAVIGRRPMTFGSWTTWLGRLAAHTSDHPDLAALLNHALLDEQNRFGLVTCLAALRQERNRAAHGNVPRSLPEYAQRTQEAGYYLEAAIHAAEFLRNFPWLLTQSVTYQPRTGHFEVSAQVAMSCHPDFDVNRYRFQEPVGTDMYYLLDAGKPVPLAPLVASRYCPRCMAVEMCFVTHAAPNAGPATLRSFTRGHDITDGPLADDIREFATVSA